MLSLTSDARDSRRLATTLLAIAIPCWFLFAYAHLYFFGYASMDSWTLAAPAAMAKTPFAITAPFLGSFNGSDRAWGLHWPGGPLLTSIVTVFLPRDPVVLVAIYLSYWLLQALAAWALTRRLTRSPWLALAAFLLVASDRNCFSVAWFQRYELLGGALGIAMIMALCNEEGRRPVARAVIIGCVFFLLPLLHPVFSGLGLSWVVYLAFRKFALRKPWQDLAVAATGYAAGWGVFLFYYLSRPWLYVQFQNHARQNVAIDRFDKPHGIMKFLGHLSLVGAPTHAATALYVVALAGSAVLLYGLWKSGSGWREYLEREDLPIFTAIGFGADLTLAQFTYHITYWPTAWPFAVALACLMTQRLLVRFPNRRRVIVGVLTALVLLQLTFLPARTYLWYKDGFVNMRSQLRDFAAALPKGRRLFVPEVLWDTYASASPDVLSNVFLNSLPYSAGPEAQRSYAAFITPRIRSGDILVIDQLQAESCLIDPAQPGWKQIGHLKDTYQGTDKLHGFDMTTYQKL